MYKGKVVLCVIPAKGGSRGVPGKNTKDLLGKPLIAYTIEQALGAKTLDRIVVSTEDKRVADISRRFGAEVPFERPAELATDDASALDVLLHAMDYMGQRENFAFDIVVLLHVTTPLRESSDIDRCVEILVDGGADNVFSVTPAHRNPYFNMVELDADGNARLCKKGSFVTRQSAPPVFDMNSSIYVWWKDVLREKKGLFLERTKVYEMPAERSIDIDWPLDFKIARMLMSEKMHPGSGTGTEE